MQHTFHVNLLLAVALTVLIGTMQPLYADTVVNSFSVRALSGGNSAKNGEVMRGESTSSVDITTTVNGEVVEDIHESTSNGYLRVESAVVSNTERTVATSTVTTQQEELGVPIAFVSPSRRFEKNVAVETTTTAPEPIINITETSSIAPNALDKENVERSSFFARVFSGISTKIAYVLSHIFSY